MNKIIKIINKYKYLFYCLFISFISLMITTKNSFLYPFNDWCDVNAFFTMGKSMLNGIVPYKDIFEQKGIILYLIYSVGYLISNTTYIGVFFIEVLFFTIFLNYLHKIVKLFVDEKYSLFILPLIAVTICTSNAFVHGGSCEELCLPFFAYCLYLLIRYFKGEELNYKSIFLNGLLAGTVFMMKYTIIGFWFAFMMCIGIDMFFIKKNRKKAIQYCIVFLLGMFLPIFLSLIYFAINGAIDDFIRCYFEINIMCYGDAVIPLLERICNIILYLIYFSYINGILPFILLTFLPLFITKLNISFFGKVSIIINFYINILIIYWGLRHYDYYYLPLLVFLIFPLINICLVLDKYIKPIFKLKGCYLLYFLVIITFTIGCYNGANYREMIGMDKSEMFQFKYADYIKQYENPTLLNMGFLDAGIYTLADILPNTYFFEVQNIDYENFPDNLDCMRENVENKEVKFIVYNSKRPLMYIERAHGYIFDNYELVYSDKYDFEHEIYNAYLFKLKEL